MKFFTQEIKTPLYKIFIVLLLGAILGLLAGFHTGTMVQRPVYLTNEQTLMLLCLIAESESFIIKDTKIRGHIQIDPKYIKFKNITGETNDGI